MTDSALSASDAPSVPAGGLPPEQAGAEAVDAVDAPEIPDVVDVTLPAVSAYLSVLRTATAGLAARLDFTLDEIEDLRIAVDEACAMVLPRSRTEGTSLMCRFELERDSLAVTVRVLGEGAQLPERESFSWTVLTALAGEVRTGTDGDGHAWICLRKRREGAS